MNSDHLYDVTEGIDDVFVAGTPGEVGEVWFMHDRNIRLVFFISSCVSGGHRFEI